MVLEVKLGKGGGSGRPVTLGRESLSYVLRNTPVKSFEEDQVFERIVCAHVKPVLVSLRD